MRGSDRRDTIGLKAPNRAALSRVLATVTHEIRTPLGGIVGMADLLAGTAATPEQMTYIEAIRTSGLALASLVDELLDISRIEAGKFDLADEPVDVSALVEGVVELLAPRAQGKGLEIASLVAADVPAAVRGDPGRLRQILLNLAGNAVKFTTSGGVGVRVEVAGDRLLLSVEDTGPGVPADRVAAIFEPFEQAAGAASAGGAGLGLTISRRLVARMGGTLDLQASDATGATFCAALPLNAASPPPPRRPAVAGRRALIVAADRFGPAYLAAVLSAEAAAVALASDAAAATACLTAPNVPDILVVDAALGAAAVQALAQTARDAGVGCSLILVSPYERRAFGPLLVGGYDGWLVKPVRPRSLFARLDALARGVRPGGAATRVRSFRALVAEDDPVNALLAARHLQRLGAEVTTVADGAAALRAWDAALAGQPFDVVLLDLRMPVLDGVGAARAIRAAEGEDPRVRLLAVTADNDPARQTAARAAGFDDVLAKPVDLGQLGRALERG